MENQKINPKKVDRYNDAIKELLNKNRVEKGADYTHISMGEYFKGKFFLNKKQIKEFNELYAEAINYGCAYSIAEKQKEYGPLIIDIDIEIPSENYTNDTRLYNNEMIFNIIDTYREVINNYLDVESDALVASLFEKKEPTKKETIIKDGFHLMFHGLNVHSKLRHLIRHDVVNLLKNCELYKGFIKPIDDIIDKAVVSSNCWLLLGSRKEKGGIYQLTTIYDDLNKPINIKNILENKNKLIKLYSLNSKYRSEDYETKFNDNITMEFINNEYNKYNEYKPNENKPNENKPNENNNDFNFIDGKTKKDFIIKLLDILDNDRSDDWRKWRDIGFIIKGEMGSDGFDIFNDFSKRSDKYNLKKVRDFFDSIKDIDNKLTLKSLLSVAKKDNNDEYRIIYKEFIKPIEKENKNSSNNLYNFNILNDNFLGIINICCSGSFYDMSKIIEDEIQKIFIYSSRTYYMFNEKNTLWETIEENFIYNYITETLYFKINKFTDIYEKLYNEASNEEKEILNKHASYRIKALKNVGNPDVIKKIFIYLKKYIRFVNFEEKLNRSHDTLLPVKNNKCINLINGETIERNKEHYFSFFINIEYKPDIETPHANEFFKSVMSGNNDKFLYLQKILGSFLSAQTEAQSIYIFWGKGSNGKSKLLKLVGLVLGKYLSTVEKGLFIDSGKKKCSSSASPELLVLKDIRVAVICETDENCKMNETLIKNLSGDDEITARGLYKDSITFLPKLSPLLITNYKPTFDINSEAMKRRLKLMNFNAKFVENPTVPHHQKMNKYLCKMLETDYLYEVLTFMVRGSIEFYKNTDMTPPKCVQDDIENYMDELDPTTNFINNKLIKTTNKKDRIMKGDLYSLFTEWSLKNGNTTPYTKKIFYSCVEKILGEPSKSMGNYYYPNIKIIDDESDSEDEDN
jgi:P4 family phage/plasmid primase-like protien